MLNTLYIYEFDTEDLLVINTTARILKEGIFSFSTTKGKISKYAVGRIHYIDKGNHTNSVFISDHAIEDALELFTKALHEERKKRII